MVSLVLAESALEIVPPEMRDHPSVVSHAKRIQKRPSEMLLDNSWHFSAMKGTVDEIKRGRPDLVHISVLAAACTPLYRNGKLDVYIHTIDDRVIALGSGLSIPRSYHRFAGMIAKLFKEKTVHAGGKTLLRTYEKTAVELIGEMGPSKVVGLSTLGNPGSFEGTASALDADACVVIGGFQKGHFSDAILGKIDELYSVGPVSHDAHVVVSRLLYEYEKTIFM